LDPLENQDLPDPGEHKVLLVLLELRVCLDRRVSVDHQEGQVLPVARENEEHPVVQVLQDVLV